MNPITKAYWIAKGVGFDNVPRRVLQALRVRSGVLDRRLADAEKIDLDLAAFRATGSVESRWETIGRRLPTPPTIGELKGFANENLWQRAVDSICVAAIEGNYPFFSKQALDIGWPPNFNVDPVNEIRWPSGKHWRGVAKSGPPYNDIKLVWEASRLTLLFYLARNYRRQNDDRWAEYGWQCVEAWIDQNPVNKTMAWACGQEVAFRLFSVLFFVNGCRESSATTIDRLLAVERLTLLSAKRVEANINYAISQKNNHGVSEAVALWLVGVLFAELPGGERFRRTGEKLLAQEVDRQVYNDGSYVQNSLSYHRVLLDNLCIYKSVCDQNGIEPEQRISRKAQSAVRWLDEMVELESGRVPNYGANDGANVLPLSCSDYSDYRPTIAASATLFEVKGLRFHAQGEWREKTRWLTSDGLRDQQIEERASGRKSDAISIWCSPEGGYINGRYGDLRLFMRAVQHRDRPNQCDLLHVDLWYRGVCVLCDAGSYRYYHEDPATKAYYYSVAAHNTVQVGKHEQMLKGPNFLWFRWPECRVDIRDNRVCATASFLSTTPYSHERIIDLGRINTDGSFRVIDVVQANEPYTLRWRLSPDVQWSRLNNTWSATVGNERISIELPCDSDVAECSGRESLYYGSDRPLRVLTVKNLCGSTETLFRIEE